MVTTSKKEEYDLSVKPLYRDIVMVVVVFFRLLCAFTFLVLLAER
jgi:hypothetical protein